MLTATVVRDLRITTPRLQLSKCAQRNEVENELSSVRLKSIAQKTTKCNSKYLRPHSTPRHAKFKSKRLPQEPMKKQRYPFSSLSHAYWAIRGTSIWLYRVPSWLLQRVLQVRHAWQSRCDLLSACIAYLVGIKVEVLSVRQAALRVPPKGF